MRFGFLCRLGRSRLRHPLDLSAGGEAESTTRKPSHVGVVSARPNIEWLWLNEYRNRPDTDHPTRTPWCNRWRNNRLLRFLLDRPSGSLCARSASWAHGFCRWPLRTSSIKAAGCCMRCRRTWPRTLYRMAICSVYCRWQFAVFHHPHSHAQTDHAADARSRNISELPTRFASKGEPLKRVHYFNGQLFSAEDLQTEQEYHIRTRRRLNLLTLGAGVASGLHVSVNGTGIQIGPGLAIDRLGNEIVIDDPQSIGFPPLFDPVWLVISYTETLTDPVPFGDDGSMQPSRIEEGFKHEYVTEPDAHDDRQVRLARLIWRGRRWEIARPYGSSLLPCCVVILGLAVGSCLLGHSRSNRSR